jgi:iron(III) transport system substrate-binding protein
MFSRRLFVAATLAAASLTPAAAQTGPLNIYTPHGPELTKPLLEAFGKKYPGITVSLITGGTGEVLNRLQAEAANPGADVMWGGPTEAFDGAPNLFDSYDTPVAKDMIVQDPNKRWTPLNILVQPIIYNTRRVSEAQAPKLLADLLDPKWQALGGISFPDPSKSGTGLTLASAISGQFGWEFMGKLVKAVRVLPGSSPAFNAVRDGEVGLGFINEDLGAKWITDGLPVKMVYPSDAVTVLVDGQAIVKGAKNRRNAELFIDWVGSKEAHELLKTSVNRRSARSDVAPPGNLPPLGSLKLITAKEPRNVVLQKFEAAQKAP